jgi:hypothetical protein
MLLHQQPVDRNRLLVKPVAPLKLLKLLKLLGPFAQKMLSTEPSSRPSALSAAVIHSSSPWALAGLKPGLGGYQNLRSRVGLYSGIESLSRLFRLTCSNRLYFESGPVRQEPKSVFAGGFLRVLT